MITRFFRTYQTRQAKRIPGNIVVFVERILRLHQRSRLPPLMASRSSLRLRLECMLPGDSITRKGLSNLVCQWFIIATLPRWTFQDPRFVTSQGSVEYGLLFCCRRILGMHEWNQRVGMERVRLIGGSVRSVIAE